MLNISSEKYFCTIKINASVDFQCWVSVKQVRSIKNTLGCFAITSTESRYANCTHLFLENLTARQTDVPSSKEAPRDYL